MNKKPNATAPATQPPPTNPPQSVTLTMPDSRTFDHRNPIELPKPAFAVLPCAARELADASHTELPNLLICAAASIREAAAKGAYSTVVAAKAPLLETLADRLARSGYVTRLLPQGVLVQWS